MGGLPNAGSRLALQCAEALEASVVEATVAVTEATRQLPQDQALYPSLGNACEANLFTAAAALLQLYTNNLLSDEVSHRAGGTAPRCAREMGRLLAHAGAPKCTGPPTLPEVVLLLLWYARYVFASGPSE